jgi:hypothetical protein
VETLPRLGADRGADLTKRSGDIAEISISGPRGVPGGPDTVKMTPQEDKNIPKSAEFDGHTA